MAQQFQPELGQALFGNNFGELECPQWLVVLIERLGDEIWRVTHNSTGAGINPTDNEGSSFGTNMFEMRSYYWGDCICPTDDDEEVAVKPVVIVCQACAPNFKFGDFEVRWYKHARRSPSMNRDITPDEATKMFEKCMASVTQLDGVGGQDVE